MNRVQMEEKRRQKELLLQTLGRKEPKRSDKPQMKKKEVKKEKFTPEELQIIKYLGVDFVAAAHESSQT